MQSLNKDFQDVSYICQNDPSQENLATLNSLKERTEKYYEEKVEGIIVRSRARWHEHAERNSKYFLNLEKRTHIRKHIRKLYRSGVITTDPFEILETEKQFYENLYKSRRTCLQQNELSFKYEELPIPTLTDEQRQSAEGKISL